jgi:hypothetical protein
MAEEGAGQADDAPVVDLTEPGGARAFDALTGGSGTTTDFLRERRVQEASTALEPPHQQWMQRRRETTRGRLAYALIGILLTALLATIAMAWRVNDEASYSHFLQGVYTPLIALVGTALGFYFGGER